MKKNLSKFVVGFILLLFVSCPISNDYVTVTEETPEPLSSPSNVNVTDGTYKSKIEISWDAVSGATQYCVLRSTENYGTYTDLTSWISEISFTDNNIIPGTTYYYKIKAKNDDIESDFSIVSSGKSSLLIQVLSWGSLGTGAGEFNDPRYVGYSSVIGIIIQDDGNSRFQIFNENGLYINEYLYADIDGLLAYDYIAYDSSGNVYNASVDRVKVIDKNGVFIKYIGQSGIGNGEFDDVGVIAIANNDNIYVVDQNNQRVQKFNFEGTFLLSWGSLGTDNGEFYYPAEIAVDNEEYVYVSDDYNRLQVFNSNGDFVKLLDIFDYAIYDIEIDSNNNVFVMLSNRSILKYNQDGNYLGRFDYDYFSYGMAIDSTDNIYLPDNANHVIKKYY